MAATTGSVGQLAGLGSRIVAYIIDMIISTVIGVVVSIPLFLIVSLAGDSALGGILYLVAQGLVLVVVYGYWIVMEGLYGHTVGKKAMSIRVVGENGSTIGMGESAIRNVLRIVDYLPFLYIIGIILIAVNDDEQRVGDIAASTYVVDT